MHMLMYQNLGKKKDQNIKTCKKRLEKIYGNEEFFLLVRKHNINSKFSYVAFFLPRGFLYYFYQIFSSIGNVGFGDSFYISIYLSMERSSLFWH